MIPLGSMILKSIDYTTKHVFLCILNSIRVRMQFLISYSKFVSSIVKIIACMWIAQRSGNIMFLAPKQ